MTRYDCFMSTTLSKSNAPCIVVVDIKEASDGKILPICHRVGKFSAKVVDPKLHSPFFTKTTFMP